MKSRNLARWTSTGSIILLAVLWTGLAVSERSHAQAGKVAKVTAEQLTKEFADDKKGAEKKYPMNLIVEVEGEVKKSEKLPSGDTWAVHLEGFEKGKGLFTKVVDCEFGAKAKSYKKAQELVPDQKVKIRGKFYSAFEYGQRLVDCELVEVGPDPAIKVTAAQLSKDFAADRKAAATKYKDKQVLLEGVVAQPVGPKAKYYVVLENSGEKGAPAVHVEFGFTQTAEKLFSQLKKGQKVTVRGRCEGDNRAGDEVKVRSTTIVP
jgi:hypothetical protein